MNVTVNILLLFLGSTQSVERIFGSLILEVRAIFCTPRCRGVVSVMISTVRVGDDRGKLLKVFIPALLRLRRILSLLPFSTACDQQSAPYVIIGRTTEWKVHLIILGDGPYASLVIRATMKRNLLQASAFSLM